ncbi:hypothetical protein Zmor_000517 [Zophobas morio]|uniref:Uncharacterized protein n=1 Tax=Zophobas morio TaxID=2755281 RepID=A0AA38J4V6_9CUCU|nr:hypothetical protein Zmor_000517 [Zophobas morio]
MLLLEPGGTKPYPEAPTTTPLVSPLSGGAGGNTTGPGFCLGSLVACKGESKPPPKPRKEESKPSKNWPRTTTRQQTVRNTMAWKKRIWRKNCGYLGDRPPTEKMNDGLTRNLESRRSGVLFSLTKWLRKLAFA